MAYAHRICERTVTSLGQNKSNDFTLSQSFAENNIFIAVCDHKFYRTVVAGMLGRFELPNGLKHI